MNQPTNVDVKKKLAKANLVSYECQEVRGKDGAIKVENAKGFENTQIKLSENIMEISTESFITIKSKDEVVARISTTTGEPLIADGQDKKAVLKTVKEFKEAIKEIGLKVFNEMLEEEKYISLGRDNEIDQETISEAVEKYLKDKQEQKEQEEGR